MKTALAFLAILALATQSCLADGSDWFAVSGVSFVEAVGSGTSYVLITRDSSGKYAILGTGEELAPGMVIKKIGSQQVLVTRSANHEQAAAPILRQQVPADALVAAICKLYNQNVVIASEMPKMLAFSDGLLNYKQELPGLVKSLGWTYLADDRVIVIRKDEVQRPMPKKVSKKDGTFTSLALRSTVSAVLASAASQTQRTFKAKAGESTVTVESSDLSPDELAAYLAAAADTDIAEEVSKPEAPTQTAAAPAAAPEPAAAPSGDVESEWQAAVTVAKTGDYRKSAGMLIKIVRARKEVPAKVTNLLGKLLWSLGKKDMARKAWRITLRREPANEFARKALAKTAAAQG